MILIHGASAMEGDSALGSYEITAHAAETAVAFAGRGITQLHTVIEPQDLLHHGSARETGIDRQHLIELAKCEIDFVLEADF